MWKLFHKLFGWQYVLIEFGFIKYVKRVKYTPLGQKYVTWCGGIYLLDTRPYHPLT